MCALKAKREGVNPRMDRTGLKKINTQGCEMEIIEYHSTHNLTVRFDDGTIVKNLSYHHFKSGKVKNLNLRRVAGIGYIGEGEYTSSSNKNKNKVYYVWRKMIERCYLKLDNQTYNDVTVCDEWHNFQNFAKWYNENYIDDFDAKWEIDKDLLNPNSKMYSPDNCVFLPAEVNLIFSKKKPGEKGFPKGVYYDRGRYVASVRKYGKSKHLGSFGTPQEAHEVYMKAKKEYLIEVSEKWRGILSDKVCEAIKNYDLSLL